MGLINLDGQPARASLERIAAIKDWARIAFQVPLDVYVQRTRAGLRPRAGDLIRIEIEQTECDPRAGALQRT